MGWVVKLSFSLKTRRFLARFFFGGKFPRGRKGVSTLAPSDFSLEEFFKATWNSTAPGATDSGTGKKTWNIGEFEIRIISSKGIWSLDNFGRGFGWSVGIFFLDFLRYIQQSSNINLGRISCCFAIWVVLWFGDIWRGSCVNLETALDEMLRLESRIEDVCACGWCIFILGSRICYTCSIRLYTSQSLY